METQEKRVSYYENLNQEIMNKAAVADEENFLENTFTEIYIDTLSSAGEIESGDVAYFFRSGMKINGFSLPEPEETGINDIDLFVSIYKNNPNVYVITNKEVKEIFEKAKKFYLKSLDGLYKRIDNNGDDSKVYDIAKYINDIKDKKAIVKIFLFTNGLIQETILPREETDNITFIPTIWDLDRMYRLETSGNARERISIKLSEFGKQYLNCVKVEVPEFTRKYINGDAKGEEYITGGYTTYLTVIPGELLYKIYEKYNVRLLEKNVRTFLQVKGKVNKGIRETIKETPEMFLAYNNGISATAESVSVANRGENYCIIKQIEDFQIVNGGQTTASIFNACQKNPISLKSINVQAKITVVNDEKRLKEVIPNISQYANTQNKVQGADFSANDPFHKEIEKFSRNIWAPSSTGGQKGSKWFYERLRGQYYDERSREDNVKQFDLIYPRSQYFDKVLLARYENLWEQLPYITSKGGQKGFAEFTLRLKKYRSKFVPNENYYLLLIAKAILYKNINKIVKNQGFQGYWANVTDYTFAFLSYKTAQRIDLLRIWKSQSISDSLSKAIQQVCTLIYEQLINSANGLNVTQWCKQEDCWKSIIHNIDIDLKLDKTDLIDRTSNGTGTIGTGAGSGQTGGETQLPDEVVVCKMLSSEQWWDIATWGKDTDSLETWQRGIAGGIAKRIGKNSDPTYKQAVWGVEILDIAVQKGFIHNKELEEALNKL